jgi:acetylornithine deacetylase/succinyl-diaminopimelate desuccinylase-like protein
LGALVDRLREYVNRNYSYLVEEVRKLLRIPSISGTGEGIREAAEFLRDWLRDRLGVDAKLLNYGGHPIVYGRLAGRSERRVVIYNMYDVQPPDPLELWEVPPFEARVVGDRIVARGAYNTKAGLMCSLLGVEALLRVLGEVPVSVTFVLEGEEEIGSPSLRKFVEDRRGELAGSYVTLFAYPSEEVPGRPTVELGNKGIVFVELRSRVSRYDVHSSLARGLYNPAAVLARVVSELLDPLTGPRLSWLEEKVVTPTPEDLEYLGDIVESVPIERVVEEYGISRTRLTGRDWYIEVFFKPSVNVDGFYSGYVGPGTKTITPAEAVVRLDFRLVPNVEPEDVIEGLRRTMERLGLSELVEVHVHDCYTWSKTDPKHPAVRAAVGVYSLLGLRPYVIPITPGAAPSYLFTRVLGVPMVSTGPGHGGRAHAPNEYVTLDTIPRLTLYVALLLAELAGAEGGSF